MPFPRGYPPEPLEILPPQYAKEIEEAAGQAEEHSALCRNARKLCGSENRQQRGGHGQDWRVEGNGQLCRDQETPDAEDEVQQVRNQKADKIAVHAVFRQQKV